MILILCLAGLPIAASAQPAGHAHEEPGQACFICDPASRDKGRLWCREHDRYEDRCWLCHPELEDPDRLYCEEHGLYEDECFLCHPELKSVVDSHDRQSPATNNNHEDHGHRGEPAHGLFCNEHGVPEVECAICQPQLAATLAPGDSLKIRMPSVDSASKAGIRTNQAEQREARPLIEAFCETQYNLNALARVTPLAAGVIRQVRHDVGDVVRAGEVLAELHSAEVADAKSAFLSASVQAEIQRKAFEREKRLREQNIAAEKDYFESEAAFQTARLAASNHRQKLLNMGLTEAEIGEVSANLETSATFSVRAPFDGTVVERNAVMGEATRTGQALFTVADLSTFWLALSVPADHAANLRPGQEVEARFAELPGQVIRGRISWVDTAVDPQSRMIRARAVVEESDLTVRQGFYGQAWIATGPVRPISLLHRDSVQKHEGRTFVFVEEEPDLYALRRIQLGASYQDQWEVLAGIDPGERIVVEGTFVVMSEFLKSRLGAGCAGH